MNLQEYQDSSALKEAQRLFEQETLTFPFIPTEIRSAFSKIDDWVYGTRSDAPWLYEIREYVLEVATKPVMDYLLLGYAGHGIQSWAMHYYLVRGPLALFLQIAGGGAYTDKIEATREMSMRFTQAEELIKAVEVAQGKGSFQSDERLIVVLTEFYDSYWTRIFGIQDRDSFYQGIFHEEKDVLLSVLSEVQKC